ncbi:ABC transporter permease [Cellulomonas gilvus]|uniref:Transport permease protein n=1 Tax=Cellulomonas gilvus (strain ATCC 13127 / NRRL B-14078) TaxID=593907 RepID=F8A175_CELGA|nr:ABC transporter permease [Cellulomonas gilvus]AEI11622.1 ABC-2 type transporter [Cellulomonas gilvus ATCC 13127]
MSGPPDDELDAAALAERYGLERIGARPALIPYVRDIWQRRHFLWTLASGRAYTRNTDNYLGQVWSILNPLLLAGTYYLVFGVLLTTRGGTQNYVAFLTTGIFIFSFISTAISSGASAITGNLSLVRALHFPRALLPLSIAVAELINLIPTIVVMLLIIALSGEPITWTWLLLVPAVAMITLFNAGCALITARIVATARDVRNLIPVGTRLLRYFSGVFYSIDYYATDSLASLVLAYQPVALYIDIVRSCVLVETPLQAHLWWLGAGWAVLFSVVGFIMFWRAEERYGRD